MHHFLLQGDALDKIEDRAMDDSAEEGRGGKVGQPLLNKANCKAKKNKPRE